MRKLRAANDVGAIYDEELVDWRQKRYQNCLVRLDGKVWFVKSQRAGLAKREMLAYLLGRGIFNVAEVRMISKSQHEELLAGGVPTSDPHDHRGICLIRFVPDCDPSELAKPSLEAAIASELVFSTWIRRRDAHSFNRSFVQGVPVFYDHQTAFLGEVRLRDLDCFFEPGPDPGYAGLWRIDHGAHDKIETLDLRARERERFNGDSNDRFVYHPARDKATLCREIDRAAEEVASIPPSEIGRLVGEAGFRWFEKRAISKFLLYHQARLDISIARLKSILQI